MLIAGPPSGCWQMAGASRSCRPSAPEQAIWQKVSNAGQLPPKPFSLRAIDFPDTARKADTSLRRFAGLSRLRRLDIYKAIPVSDADAPILATLKSLRYLKIRGDGLTATGLAALDQMPDLEILYIYGVAIGDKELPHVLALKKLRSVGLYNSNLDDSRYRQLLTLPNLASLVVSEHRLTDRAIEDLAKNPRITGVGLCASRSITRAGILALARLDRLQGLQLFSTDCSDTEVEQIARLKDLENLWLSHTRLTDIGLAHLASLKKLKSLHMTDTRVTAAGVAALQKALPKCKIEWDGPAAKPPVSQPMPIKGEAGKPWQTPAFQQWMKTVAAMPAEQQLEAVAKKLMELNPGFDGKFIGYYGSTSRPKIENGVVTELKFSTERVTDLSPVRAFSGLKTLSCYGSPKVSGKLSDLSPLEGMKLTRLQFYLTQVSDLSPLAEMKLTHLDCSSTFVSDLAPLRGMGLTVLDCRENRVSDLSPLEGMKLAEFNFTPKKITKGLNIIRQMTSLKRIGIGHQDQDKFPAAEFWRKYDAGEFGQPAAPATLAYLDPAFQQWVKETQGLPAEKQIEAVNKKLMELNPEFDGKVTPRVEKGVVTKFGFSSEKIADVSPVRALAGLKGLDCHSAWNAALSDLSPLRGMQLTSLSFYNTQVSDLSPLEGMPLTMVSFSSTGVSDLSPLRGMPLETLHCGGAKVSDLSPLRRTPLTDLRCAAPCRCPTCRHCGHATENIVAQRHARRRSVATVGLQEPQGAPSRQQPRHGCRRRRAAKSPAQLQDRMGWSGQAQVARACRRRQQ